MWDFSGHLAEDQFQPGFFQPGSLLCMLCILLWALCVYKDPSSELNSCLWRPFSWFSLHFSMDFLGLRSIFPQTH